MKPSRLRAAIAGLSLALPLGAGPAGCGSGGNEAQLDASGRPSPGDADMHVAAIQDASPDLLAPPCSEPLADRPDGGVCVQSVEAVVVDDTGAPVAGLLVSVCGADCFFGETRADGSVSVEIGFHLLADTYSLVLHGRPDRAGYYVRLPPLEAGVARFPSPLRLAALPASGPTVALDGSQQTLVSGDVTLTLPSGATVEPSVEEATDNTHPVRFRTLRVVPGPAARQPAFLDGIGAADRPAALWAVTPYEALITGKTDGVRLSFANTASFPPGAALDLLTLGSLAIPGGPPPGVLAPVATAHVSADGTRVDVDPGSPIAFLSWFGLRAKGR